MAFHNKYWSNSKIADIIRGTIKPKSLGMKEWKDWETTAYNLHQIRFWIAEEGLDKLQDILMYPFNTIDSARYYINNRWITKTHCLSAHPSDIEPGSWQDVGDRFLPCLFNEFIDFIEIELAWWGNIVTAKENYAKFKVPWYRKHIFRLRNWRCPAAGLDYLSWASQLKYDSTWMSTDNPLYGTPTPQALAAIEMKKLYIWWTEVYRNRPDPYDASGWSAVCYDKTVGSMFDDSLITTEAKQERDNAHKKLREIEIQYEQEDEDMMIRLIKVRHNLWT